MSRIPYTPLFIQAFQQSLHSFYIDLLLISDLADIISTVEFDHTGNYLATGDKGGRVVLFERNETVCNYLSPLFTVLICTPDTTTDGHRKKHASTSSILSFSLTNPNSITLNLSKLKKRSTRSNGAKDKMPPTISSLQMIKLSSYGKYLRSL